MKQLLFNDGTVCPGSGIVLGVVIRQGWHWMELKTI
jgi:hypothetical protein